MLEFASYDAVKPKGKDSHSFCIAFPLGKHSAHLFIFALLTKQGIDLKHLKWYKDALGLLG